MKKTIKINDDYKISGKLIFDKENNKGYIEIYDNGQWIEKDIKFYEYENINKAIDELKYCIKRNKNCKLGFSIMKYFMDKGNDLDKSRDNVYEINNNFDDLDCMIDDRIDFIKNHNVKIINHY